LAGHVFVSYSHQDKAYVDKLVQQLRSRALLTWYDEHITPGRPFSHEIQKQIDTCSAFLLVMSPAAKQADWVQAELSWAQDRRRPILPMLLAGERFMSISHLQVENVVGGKLPTPSFFARIRGLVDAGLPPRSDFSGRLVATMDGQDFGSVLAVAWAPAAPLIATAYAEHTKHVVQLWNAESHVVVNELRGHDNQVRAVAWSADGLRIATASADGTARVWDSDGTPLLRLAGHEREVLTVAWSPDSSSLATASSDDTTCVWDAATGELVTTLHNRRGGARSVTWSPDGTHLAVAREDSTVAVYETGTGDERQTLSGHDGLVHAVAWCSDGHHLASAAGDHTARVWQPFGDAAAFALAEHESTVWSVAWAPNGRHLATASGDRTVRVWEPFTGMTSHALRGHDGSVWSVSWSPDGRHLASGSADGTARIWEIWRAGS
jgi:WD40 repeat protein